MRLSRNQLLLLAISLVTVVAVALIGLVVACVLVFPVLDPFDDQRFDQATWAIATSTDRQPMARDVIQRVVVKGATEAEIQALLGKPDTICDSRDFRQKYPEARKTFWYFVGSASSAGLDSAFVYVHFDAGDRVIAADIGGG